MRNLTNLHNAYRSGRSPAAPIVSITLKREGPGLYTYKGYTVERVDRDAEEARRTGLPAGVEWYLTYPGQVHPDGVHSTLRDARGAIVADLEDQQ